MVSNVREQLRKTNFWLKFSKYFVIIISVAIVGLIGLEAGLVKDALIQTDRKVFAAVDGLGITFDEGYQQTIHYTVFNDHGSSFEEGDIPAHLSIFHCKTQGLDSCAPDLTPGDFVRAIKDQAPITVTIPKKGGQLNDYVSAETVNCGRVQMDIGLLSPGNPKILGGKVYSLGKNCDDAQPSTQPSAQPSVHPSQQPSSAPSQQPQVCVPGAWSGASCSRCNATGTGFEKEGSDWGNFDGQFGSWCGCAQKYSQVTHGKVFDVNNYPQCFNPQPSMNPSPTVSAAPSPSPDMSCPVNSACCFAPVKACTSDGLDTKGECSEPFKWCYQGKCVHRDFNPNTNSCISGGIPTPIPSASPAMISCTSLVPNKSMVHQVGDTFTVTTNINPANGGWTKAEVWLFTAANQQPTDNIGWFKLGETTPANPTLSYMTNSTELITEGEHVIGMKIFNGSDVVNWGTDVACRSTIDIVTKQSPTPSLSPSPSVKASPSIAASPKVTPSASASHQASPSVSPSVSPSASPSVSPSVSPSAGVGGTINCPDGQVSVVKDSVIVCVNQNQSQTQENTQIVNLHLPSTSPTHVVAQGAPGHIKGTSTMKELPRTGVPGFVIVAGGFLLLGFKFRKFGSSLQQEMERTPHYLVEERKYKKQH